MGGDKVHYPGDVGTPTADLTLVKMHVNSVISTPGARYMTLDVKNFYLNTPMVRYEYVRIKIDDIPEEIIVEYNLREKVTSDGHVYVEIQKGMYGLPQAGILAQQLLEQRLNEHGYSQSKAVPGLWTHETRPISFTLVVDDFGVKYVGKENAMHLISILKQHYEISEDWTGSKYIGITFDWDYANKRVHLSMPGYISKALQRFGHEMRGREDCRILPILTLHQHTEQRRSMLSRMRSALHLTKRERSTSKLSPVHCCITAEPSIQLCW